jgi:quercetin dioxygenase-like cupin family protein
MTSIDRPLSGDMLIIDYRQELAAVMDDELLTRNGRNARTLLKDGPLRVTLVALEKGGGMPPHTTNGPITVQPVQGRIRLRATAAEHELGPGELLSVAAGVEHSVHADERAAFLLTVVHPAV